MGISFREVLYAADDMGWGGFDVNSDLIERTTEQRILDNAWDQVYRENPDQIQREPYSFFGHVLSSFRKRGVQTVVDVACGAAGRHTIPLLNEGYNVIAFDLSETAIQLTQVELHKQGHDVDSLIQQGRLRLDVHDMFVEWPAMYHGAEAVFASQCLSHGYPDEIRWFIRMVHDTILADQGIFVFNTTKNLMRSLHGADLNGLNFHDMFRKVGDNTFIPLVGREKNIPHTILSPPQIFDMLDELYAQVHIFEDRDNDYLIVDARKNGALS